MIAIPAIDLRDGCCVQLVGGAFDAERVRLPDPVSVAQRWVECGFRRLHVVDLDAALGRGSNADIVEQLVALPDIDVQVGGGLRSTEAVERVISAGARRIVVGTRAVTDRAWLEEIATRWPDRVVVAADVRAGRVATEGWTVETSDEAPNLLSDLSSLPVSGFLVTAVDREGRMAGPDTALVQDCVRRTSRDVVASGGVGSRKDLVALAESGAAAAVIGMALYTGAIDATAIAREFDR